MLKNSIFFVEHWPNLSYQDSTLIYSIIVDDLMGSTFQIVMEYNICYKRQKNFFLTLVPHLKTPSAYSPNSINEWNLQSSKITFVILDIHVYYILVKRLFHATVPLTSCQSLTSKYVLQRIQEYRFRSPPPCCKKNLKEHNFMFYVMALS